MPFVPDKPTSTFETDEGIKPTSTFVADKPTSTFVADKPKEELKEFHFTDIPIVKTLTKQVFGEGIKLPEKYQIPKKETGKWADVLEQGVQNYYNTLLLGLPEKGLKKLGYKLPEPKTPMEAIGVGVGSLGGFIKGPIQLAGKIAPKIPFIGRAFAPAETIAQAVVKPLIRTATTLGTARALMTPSEGLFEPGERIREFGGGAITGTVFGGISFIPSTPLRMVMSSAYIGVPATIQEQPLEQQIFSYGLGAWFGKKGATPKEVLAREKPLAQLIRFGSDKAKPYLEENEKLLQYEKDLSVEYGRDPISRKGKFEEVTRGRLKYYRPIEKEGTWKKNIIKNIRQDIIKLKRDPNFQLETGDMDFLVNYVTKDLGFRTSDLTKLDSATLYNMAEILRNYQPPTETPFVKPPPLKPQFAERDWSKKINPWDRSLRGAFRKLEKFGFGKETEEGFTGTVFSSASVKARFLNRNMSIINNWGRVTGFNKQRSNDMFAYLNGELHPNYLTKMHGEKTLRVVNQMRGYLDTQLNMRNRHRAMYGESPIEPRKNYITHLFEDLQAELIAKKHPFPDWLAETMPYIIPKQKISRFEMPRKGGVGYQRDIWKALHAYTYDTAVRTYGDNPIRQGYKISNFLKKQIAFEKRTGQVSETDLVGIKQNIDDYVKDLQGRPGKLDQTLRGLVDPINSILSKLPNNPQIRSLNDITDGMVSLIYGSQMAYRPKLPIRNLGQHSLIIGQTGFKPLGWAVKNRNTQQSREILKHSKLLPTRERAFGAETQALFGKSGLQKAVKVGLKPYKWADIINVEDAYLSGYKQAIDNPKKWPNPYKRGDEVAALTQYVYLPENRSDLARGFGLSKTLGRPLSLFTTWPANWVDFNIASASNPDTRKNLLKYWATALAFTGVTATMGIKGAEYVGIKSPLSLLQIAKGKLPISGIAERPRFVAGDEFKKWIDGDKTLKEIFFYTFEQE